MDYEGVLVQGIIDVFWLEEDRIVLLDYKTDRVQNTDELVQRYKTQLDLYAKALSNIFSVGKTEKMRTENLIYSFCFGQVIQLNKEA
jgi:ATP-dependent helicase/nuclease subunit A